MKYELWPEVLQELANHLSEETITRWFKNVLEVEKKQSTLYLRVYSEEQAAWMETHYSQILQESANKVADENLDIIYIADEHRTNSAPAESVGMSNRQTLYIKNTQPNPNPNRFNPRYTFESFVVGSSNRFAHAAALAVADRPAKNYR